MPYPEDTANKHARRDVRLEGRWTCLCDACRAQRAIDDAHTGTLLEFLQDPVAR
jgi:hypothetical protein